MADTTTIAEKIAQAETERQRIASNIAAAYDEAEAKGATMPATKNSSNLADTVASIPTGSDAVLNSLIEGTLTELSSNVKSVGDNAFCYNETLESVSFPQAESIGISAFESCTSLGSVSIPNVKSIEDIAFFDTFLISVSLPMVETIGSSAFSSCLNLNYIDLSDNYSAVPKIESDSFRKTGCKFLFRDQEQLDEYASATNWSALASRFQIKGATT